MVNVTALNAPKNGITTPIGTHRRGETSLCSRTTRLDATITAENRRMWLTKDIAEWKTTTAPSMIPVNTNDTMKTIDLSSTCPLFRITAQHAKTGTRRTQNFQQSGANQETGICGPQNVKRLRSNAKTTMATTSTATQQVTTGEFPIG